MTTKKPGREELTPSEKLFRAASVLPEKKRSPRKDTFRCLNSVIWTETAKREGKKPSKPKGFRF